MLRKPNIDYLEALRYPRGQRIVELACKNLSKVKFDALAFTGMSGAMIAPAIAYEMGKGLIMVRKGGSKDHSLFRVEGYIDADAYVILDDFICAGNTVKRVARMIKKASVTPRLAGIYEYHGDWLRKRPILTTKATAAQKRSDPLVRDLLVELFQKYGA